MYIAVYISVKSPPLYFPPAGGKPRNTSSFKSVEGFSCPRRGKDVRLAVLRTVAAGGQKVGFF